jgi:tripartite ATP-independent transporter DctM subunit
MIIFLVFMVALLMGAPIVFALLMGGFGAFFLNAHLPMQLLGPRMANAVNSYPLLAIPLFIMAAEILSKIRMTDAIFEFANKVVGHIKGGLAHVNVLSSVIFAGMTGSAVAEAAALGRVQIKAMTEAGFDPRFSAAITAASSTLGPIIPPSIPLVIYGVLAEVSVGRLLIGGLIPGLIIAALLMVGGYILAARRNYPRSTWPGLRVIGRSFVTAFPALLAPVILIGGMIGGVFTPTEAAAAAVIYALALGFLTRRLTLAGAWETFRKAATASAGIMFVVVGASLVGLLVTRLRLTDALVMTISTYTDSPAIVLMLINVLLLIAGCLLDATSCIVLFTPILVPMAKSFGIDLVHFGLVVVLNLMIGLLTPPMGLSMFIVCDIAKITTPQFVKEALPFIGLLVAGLLVITYVPQTVLWLPNLVIGR